MKYILKATKIEITPDITKYIDKKMAALDKHMAYFGTAVKTHIEVERTTHHRKGDVFRAEMRVYVPGKELRAEAMGQTALEAMDRVKDEISNELERHKEKTVDLKKRGARKIKRMTHGE